MLMKYNSIPFNRLSVSAHVLKSKKKKKKNEMNSKKCFDPQTGEVYDYFIVSQGK